MKYLETSADISDDGAYRYWLSRRLAMGERTVLFVGLNPSKADATADDPTIRRCVGFARAWAFDWLLMGNIYAYRATDPKVMWVANRTSPSIIYGPGNQDALRWMVAKAETVVCAWGAWPLDAVGDALAGWLRSRPHARCLGFNADGSPKHPLYIPAAAPLMEMR